MLPEGTGDGCLSPSQELAESAPDTFVVAEPEPLTGVEQVLPGVSLWDFWAWALGDLRLNSTRGMFAQFLVAKALSDPRLRDDGWGNFDVLTPEGIKVEVKSSGYLQSWTQKKLSKIVFSGLKGRSWDAETGYSAEPEFRADVYVFAVHTCQDQSTYDPLDLDAWIFYVLPAEIVRDLGQKTLSLARLAAKAPPRVSWSGLPDAVENSLIQ
jgi:hypothetical protein